MATDSRAATLKTGSLLLDSKNTRIPSERRSEEQRVLLHQLLEHEDVRGLAASIAKLGLFPNERLVVTPANTKMHVVLEGNRRLAAIKLLLNPSLAPTNTLVKYFRVQSAMADLAQLAKLEVAIVRSRVAAAPIIAALHTREAKRKWSSLQQARFYRELVDEGQTPDEISARLGIALGQVNSYLRTEKLYRICLTLDHPAEVEELLKSSDFPLTTLQRFIESKVGRKFLGIELDDKDGFRGTVHPDRFKAVLKKVTADVATERGLTRKINSEEDFGAYVVGAEKAIPKTAKEGSFSPDDLLTDEDDEEADPPLPPRKPRKREPTPSKSVIPKGFTCSQSGRTRAIFDELRKIQIETQPNSTGVMLRVLIEVALRHYLVQTNQMQRAIDGIDNKRKKRNHNPHWSPALTELLSFAVDNQFFPGMTADAATAVRSLVSKDIDSVLTIESFNGLAHSTHLVLTESELRALWLRAEPMLEIILNS